MKILNNLAAGVTLALGLLATLLVYISGRYWALLLCAVVLLVDFAVVAPGIWLPSFQRWWMRGRKQDSAAAPAGGAAERPGNRKFPTAHSLKFPAQGEVCMVVELDAYDPRSRSVVRFRHGSRRADYTIARTPDDALQILGQSGWS